MSVLFLSGSVTSTSPPGLVVPPGTIISTLGGSCSGKLNVQSFLSITSIFRLLPAYAAVLKQPAYTPAVSANPGLTAQPWQKFDPSLVTPELKYQLSWTGATVIIDINGSEAPNIVGRDLFEFTISNTGKLPTTTSSLSTLKTNCQNGNASSCFTYVMANGWKMDY